MSQEMNDYLREIERNIRLNDARNEAKHDMIIAFYKKGVSLEIISEASKLSLDEVKKIIEESK